MSKNTVKLGIAGLTAAATGAALFTAKKVNDKKEAVAPWMIPHLFCNSPFFIFPAARSHPE